MRFAATVVTTLAVCLAHGACAGCVDESELGAVVPLVSVTSRSLAFADTFVGVERRLVVRIESAGNAPLVGVDAALTGAPAFALEGAPPTTIDGGASFELVVRFAPATPGDHAGTLVVTSNADNDPELTVALTGRGLAPPDCDDDDACTFDTFDLVLETCVHGAQSGACDDENACTTGDTCVDGACVGVGVVCADPVACTIDACDPLVGCRFIPDDDACVDDDNPCTLETCDAVAGCQTAVAQDGTPCGPFAQCQPIRACMSGVCESFPIPEGTTCVDGNPCTVDDRCTSGVCAGELVTQDPAVVTRLPLFGGTGARAASFDDGRIAFVDFVGGALANTWGELDRAVLTVTDAAGAVTFRADLDGAPAGLVHDVHAFTGGLALTMTGAACGCVDDDCPRCVVALSDDGDGSFTAHPGFALPAVWTLEPSSGGDGRLYGCLNTENAVVELDLRDPAAPVERVVALPASCGAVGVAPELARVAVMNNVGGAGVTLFDVTDTGLVPVVGGPALVGSPSTPVFGVDRLWWSGYSKLLALDVDTGVSSEVEWPSAPAFVIDLAFQGTRAAVYTVSSSVARVSLVDFAVVDTPVVLDELVVPGGSCPTCAYTLAWSDDRILLTRRGAPPLLVDASDDELTVVAAPDRGDGPVVKATPAAVYALADRGFHRAVVDADGGAVFVEAARLPEPSASTGWMFADDGGLGYAFPDRTGDLWFGAPDMSLPFASPDAPVRSPVTAAPLVGGLTFAEATEVPWASASFSFYTTQLFVDDARYRVRVTCTCEVGGLDTCTPLDDDFRCLVELERTPILGFAGPPLARDLFVPLDVRALFGSDAWAYDPVTIIAVERGGARAAVLITFVEATPTLSEFRTAVFLVDGLDTDAPEVRGASLVDALLVGPGVVDDHVLAVEAPGFAGGFQGTALHVLTPDDAGGLVVTGTLPLARANHVALAASPVALVSTAQGVEFVTVDGQGAPLAAFSLPLHEPPLTADLSGDFVVLGQSASTTIAFPPCALP